MLLQGKVCIVTGAASVRGIGRGIARMFAEHGARIAVLDLDEARTREAAASLAGGGHRGWACDVTDHARCRAVASEVRDAFGQLDVLVNNAGTASPSKLMEIDPAGYHAMMEVNLRGVFNMCQAVMPAMQARRSGSIVNIASVAAQRGGGVFGGPHYAAAKGGVISLTKAIAREFGPEGIRANAVCPSLVETDIHGGAIVGAKRDAIIATIPLGRPGTTQDVAGACLFLASELSAFVTGATIDVNGGSHIH